MSRYLKQTGLPFRDRDCLVEALRAMGHLVVVYDTPQQLIGYAGDSRPETAEIILSMSVLEPCVQRPWLRL